MRKECIIDSTYFREYRTKFGFSNQNTLKDFLAGKDVKPIVDYSYIEEINKRLCEIIKKINNVVPKDQKIKEMDKFCKEHLIEVYKKLKENKILPLLNNQGRRPEQVYFSWMRGYVISNYFLKALSDIFGINLEEIEIIGEDDFTNLETFKRTPTADLQIKKGKEKIRIEMQAGFQGINDIKQHKVLEAKRMYNKDKTITLAIHFDIFNGQVAFIKLNEIEEDSVNWITRQQMEGQTVFNIDQNYFIWKLMENPPKYEEIQF
jgi:hypothetical protein